MDGQRDDGLERWVNGELEEETDGGRWGELQEGGLVSPDAHPSPSLVS